MAGPGGGAPPSPGRRVEALRPFRIAWLYFRVGVMNELQYRINFFIQLFQAVLQLGTGLVVLALVFSHTRELHGWSAAQLVVVLGIQILMGGVIQGLIQPNMTRLMEEVRLGKLDYALTKPEDSQVLVSVREIRIWEAVDVLTGGIVVGFGVAHLRASVGALDALSFVAAVALGGIMVYCFWLVLTTGAFWFVRIDQIVELFEGVYQTGRWPVTVYPLWLRSGLTFLVPIAFAVTVPAEALTSRLNGETLALAAVLCVAFLAFTRWFWRRGLKRYSGASA